MKKKTAILTWHYYHNFGSALQAYALQTALEQQGVDVKILNYRNPRFAFRPYEWALKRNLGKIAEHLPFPKAERYTYRFLRFRKDYLHESLPVRDPAKLIPQVKDCSHIVCGSDQIWAPNVFHPVYMADFVPGDRISKLSYAASVGLNEIPANLRDTYRNLLSDFKAVSVREDAGGKLLRDCCGIDSVTVLDPTLLLTAQEYEKLEKAVEVKSPYLFCYFLNENHQYRQSVEAYAKKHGLQIIGYSQNRDDSSWMDLRKYIGPREFLWLVHHAAAVCTDSYHGTIFSLLYHKEVFSLERFSSDDPVCQNSRIYQLDAWFGIGERILKQPYALESCPPIDYGRFEELLAAAREQSIHFLREGLR